MALARCQLTVTDEAGNLVDGASIEVRNEDTLALPSVYSNRAGSISLGNPFVASSGADAGFHVVGGSYKITATKGLFQRIWRYVAIGMAQEFDIGAVNFVNVKLGVGQSVAAGAVVKVQLKTKISDVDNVFDAVTNYRYQPTISGKFVANLVTQWISLMPPNTLFGCSIYKNGAEIQGFPISRTGGTAQDNCSMGHTILVDMNGSTDYLECMVYHNTLPAANQTLYDFAARTSFSVARVAA